MSVYKPPQSRFWQYDFVIQGKRFHGSTGQTTRRAAEAVERKKRQEAGSGELGATARMSLDDAAGRWWEEVGIDRGDAVDVERRVAQLLAIMGPATPLGDIDQVAVATAIEKRRRRLTYRSQKPGAVGRPPSNATVNRDIIETLRPILSRARTHWTPKRTQHGLPEIGWRELRLPEPRGLSRIYPPAEREAWLAACPDELTTALKLLLKLGLRFGELFFSPDRLNLDPADPTLTLQKGRKRDVILHVPLTQDLTREVGVLASRAKAAADQGLWRRPDAKGRLVPADVEHLWFYQDGPYLVAFTQSQVEYRLSKAADEAGIQGGRRIHGARHHAGGDILRRSKNFKAVQALLGHASIQSSQRYAHVLNSDLRAFLEDEVASPAPSSANRKAGNE